MLSELDLRKDYLGGEPIETIYFGGGTPSLLTVHEINSFLEKINENHRVSPQVEITMEANPDDLTREKVGSLKTTGINRFSIGVQSFFDEDLKWMNRAHKADEALFSIAEVQHAGFENISIDLIYGYPLLNDKKWAANLDKVISLGIPHVSCYSMTVEPSTPLDQFIRKGTSIPMNEDQSAAQFEFLMTRFEDAGYQQYEISNFCLPGHISIHNSNYWKRVSYLGIGPSAHSFIATKRSWNVRNNNLYVRQIEKGAEFVQEFEELSLIQQLNEYTMTSIRTAWGIDLSYLELKFGKPYREHIWQLAQKHILAGFLLLKDHSLLLTQNGKFLTDQLTADLFLS